MKTISTIAKKYSLIGHAQVMSERHWDHGKNRYVDKPLLSGLKIYNLLASNRYSSLSQGQGLRWLKEAIKQVDASISPDSELSHGLYVEEEDDFILSAEMAVNILAFNQQTRVLPGVLLDLDYYPDEIVQKISPEGQFYIRLKQFIDYYNGLGVGEPITLHAQAHFRPYRVDFLLSYVLHGEEYQVAIEFDEPFHKIRSNRQHDIVRDEALADKYGLSVIRVAQEDVEAWFELLVFTAPQISSLKEGLLKLVKQVSTEIVGGSEFKLTHSQLREHFEEWSRNLPTLFPKVTQPIKQIIQVFEKLGITVRPYRSSRERGLIFSS